MTKNVKMKDDKEIVFQIRINRQNGSFEYVKKDLEPFEQCGFELFIRSYASFLKTMRDDLIESEEFETDDEDEEEEKEQEEE